MHVLCIVRDSTTFKTSHEGVKIHVNDAITPVYSEFSEFSIVTLLPSLIIVGPGALIAVLAMRVSDFDNLGPVGVLELNYTNDSVRVAQD